MPTYADVVCRAKLYFRNRIEAIKKSVHSHDQKPKRAERTPTKHDKTRERPSHRHRNWNSLTFSKFRVTVGVTVRDGVTAAWERAVQAWMAREIAGAEHPRPS